MDDLRHSCACFLRKILIGSDVFPSHYQSFISPNVAVKMEKSPDTNFVIT